MLMNRNLINERFMQEYLPDFLLKEADLSEISNHKYSFLDSTYHEFIYDLLFSLRIKNNIAYVYITLHWENLSSQLITIIQDKGMEAIKLWHSKRDDISMPERENNPIIFPISFKTKKKSESGAKLN